MPVIFLTCFHSLLGRNIIAAILPRLALGGIRAVLVVPDYKREYFGETFGGSAVIIEGLTPNLPTRSFLGLFFKRLQTNMVQSQTVAIQQRYKRDSEGKFWYYYSFFLPARIFGSSPLLVRLVRWLDYLLSPSGSFNTINAMIERYRPQAVVLTDVQNENDVNLGQCARRAGIRVIGMVRSWDNLTQYGSRFLPDHLLVASNIIKAEAMRFLGLPHSAITVIGIPHYDRYLLGPRQSREEFLRRHGLDPNKKIILFAPVGDIYIAPNTVDRVLLEQLASLGANVFVRFPPTDTVECLDDYKPPAGVFFDRPGRDFAGRGIQIRELTPEDDERLMAAIASSDVVIAGPSTILVDGCFFGKPAILVAVDPVGELDYIRSARRYLDYDHMRNLVRSKAVRVSYSLPDVSKAVLDYLADPSLDSRARNEFITDYCGGIVDGSSSQRAAEAILDFLKK